ncbi:MAG: hypothetical protein D3904_11130, partial [Candidatus Electrothrix sp. EH2]|nr:hypothetical protein [Candidatus Electrothrix sp. EH2]
MKFLGWQKIEVGEKKAVSSPKVDIFCLILSGTKQTVSRTKKKGRRGRMKQSVQRKAIGTIRELGLAAGLISTGMLCTQVQAAVSFDQYSGGLIDLSFGLEEMTGDMTSSIGGEINHADGQNESTFFPISELEWPMDILLARFDGTLHLNPMW